MKIGFFLGLLFPVFIMVLLARIVMNDMKVMPALLSWWTLVCTIAGAAIGTVLESTLKPKPVKKIGQK